MKEIFVRFVMCMCFAGIGGIALVALVRFTFPILVRDAKEQAKRVGRRGSFMLVIPLAIACALIVKGSTKNNTQTNAPQSQMQLVVQHQADKLQELRRVEKWWRRGGLNDGYVVTFDDDWCFPYGTNHLTNIEVWATGAVYPSEKCPTSVAELVTKLSLKPYDTEVFVGRTTNNSYRIEWHRGHPNRSHDQVADAAIELCRNGNVIVTENGAENLIPYVIPFAHDGFGQDDDWVRANFTNAEEILTVGYANWVDAHVGVGQLNGFYKFTASFEDVPPEPTQLYIGDYSVCVTNVGDNVFLLEKGTEYEFGTWPFNEEICYFAQDDMADDAPMLMSWWGGWESPGEWSADGGWNWLYYPTFSYPGCVNWLPVLQGSPNVIHLGEADFPKLFTAIVTDYADSDSSFFEWNSSDENIQIETPYARQTMVSVGTVPSWEGFDLSVSTVINGWCLTSSLGSCSYGTNEVPQVRFDLNIPKGIPVKGPRVPASFSFDCDVATNGWLVLECSSGSNLVSLWQSATNGTAYVCSNNVESAKSFSSSFYVNGDVRSRSFEDVTWKLSFYSSSGDTNSVCSSSTVFGCYCQPIMEARIPAGTEFYNPCAVQTGSNVWFRADVVPTVPASNIVWRAENGAAQFPDGNNGPKVRVSGSSTGDVTLGVGVLDYTDERMKFELEVVE